MKCGERGHLTVAGLPCQQTIGEAVEGCLWHSSSPEERKKLAMRGALASRARTVLPSTAHDPAFDTRESIVAWAQDMAGKVLRGQLDPKLSAEARGYAQLALQARTAEAQEQLVRALMAVEHGSTALILLQRLQEGLGQGSRRPLPGRARLALEGETS